MKNNSFDKSRYKLAAFDLDGTVLNQGSLSEANRKALWALHQQGVELAISTGRHHRMIPIEIRNLPFFRYAITSNGAHIIDLKQNKDVSFSPFDSKVILQFINLFSENADVTHIFTRDRVLISCGDFFTMKKILSKNKRKDDNGEIFQWARLILSPRLHMKLFHPSVVKISAYFRDKDNCSSILKQINQNYKVEAVSTNGRDIETTSKGVDKGTGLLTLCNHLGINIDDTITFGDSSNDIAILRRSGYAVVMGNASEDVKQHADFVSLSVEADGVAHAINTLFV